MTETISDEVIEYNNCELETLSIDRRTLEEIPQFTLMGLSEKQLIEAISRKFSMKNIIRLFISYILDATYHNTIEKCFLLGNHCFKRIMIRGVVVGLKLRPETYKKSLLLVVDDGTGALDCFLDIHNNECEILNNKINNSLKLVNDSEQENYSHMLDAASMMLTNAKEYLQAISHKNYKVGDTVKLTGSLSEYKGKRYCFVSKIIKETCMRNSGYFEDVYGFCKQINCSETGKNSY